MERPCKPHWWKTPKPGDDGLECDVCGRRLAFATMRPDVQRSIISGYAARHGEAAGEVFKRAVWACTMPETGPENAPPTVGLPNPRPSRALLTRPRTDRATADPVAVAAFSRSRRRRPFPTRT